MNRNKSLQSVFVILVFLIALYGKRLFQHVGEISFDLPLLNLLYSYAWWIVPIVISIGILFGFKNVVKELCLDRNVFIGFAFSLIVVSPMLISSAMIGQIDTDLDLLTLLRKTLFAGLMEEILFRGFLFGILFRKLGWGFIPASALGATIFALSHLYQGSSAVELIGIFTITFIGSAWFAWLFIEWKENLWIPIFLHGLMNLSWTLFNMSSNVLGDTYTNIFRIVTIVLTVVATIQFNRRKDKFRVNGNNLFRNRNVG
jgi:membrane protease YdiL (CAAX protease family)